MTINDLRCDLCGRFLSSPARTVRFVYHPGVPELRDDTGLACEPCWDDAMSKLDLSAPGRCAASACGAPAPRRQSLHVRRFDVPGSWRLCGHHAVAFLNALRTVEPKLDEATFRFPGSG
jgi:hypothetical protein